MITVYLLLVLCLYLVRVLSGYDSRYQTGKYILVKNAVLCAVLLDSMSLYAKTKRLKADKNKMSPCGVAFYAACAAVLILNIAFAVAPAIPCEAWGFETSKMFVYADTLGEKVSAIAILLLFSVLIGYAAFSFLRSLKGVKPRWIRVFTYAVLGIMMLFAAASSVWLLTELFACFL